MLFHFYSRKIQSEVPIFHSGCENSEVLCISLLCPLYNCGCTRKEKACSGFGKDPCSGAVWFENFCLF